MECLTWWQSAMVALMVVAFVPFVVLTWGLLRRVRSLRADYERRLGALTDSQDELRQKALAAERALCPLERSKTAMFELVERIERQRDEWSAMHMSDSVKHVATAAVYDRELKNERVRIYHLLQTLNAYRKAEGRPVIRTPKHLDSELGIKADPVGKVIEYVEQLERLYVKGHPDFARKRGEGEDRPPDIDAVAERTELVAWLDEQAEEES